MKWHQVKDTALSQWHRLMTGWWPAGQRASLQQSPDHWTSRMDLSQLLIRFQLPHFSSCQVSPRSKSTTLIKASLADVSASPELFYLSLGTRQGKVAQPAGELQKWGWMMNVTLKDVGRLRNLIPKITRGSNSDVLSSFHQWFGASLHSTQGSTC